MLQVFDVLGIGVLLVPLFVVNDNPDGALENEVEVGILPRALLIEDGTFLESDDVEVSDQLLGLLAGLREGGDPSDFF